MASHAAAAARNGFDPASDPLTQYLNEIGRYALLTAEQEIELAQTIEAGKDAASRLDSADYKTTKERRELEKLVAAGDEAKETFLAANLRLVVANARAYSGRSGIDLLDLIQEGNLGIIRAVEKYDWRKGFKFSTYATWWIRQALSRAAAEKSRTVRIPTHLHETIGKVKAAQATLRSVSGTEPTPDELAEETGIDLEDVARALSVVETDSIDRPIGEDGAYLGDFIQDADAPDPHSEAEALAIGAALQDAIDRLPAREQRILRLRYGFADGIPHALDVIGAELSLTPERIRQIEKLALSRLRHPVFGLREEDLV